MESLLDFTARGPHAVGLRTLELPAPDAGGRVLPTDLWYPAQAPAESEGRGSAEHPFHQPHEAWPDAPALPGPFPLLVFSHGNSGIRQQSTFLTTHLASWGIGVVAPDHTGNTFPEMANLRDDEERKQVHLDARARRPNDALAVLEAALAGRFEAGEFDASRIGAMGHSFGGWTASKLPALDERIRAVCGLAPASEAFVGRKAYADGELPFARKIPALIIAGIDDVLVDLDASVKPFFDRLDAPRALVGVEAADHFHFCDGVELLHRIHIANPRPNATRPALPFAQTLEEARMHRLLQAVVTTFFTRSLRVDATPDETSWLNPTALRELDAAAIRLDDAV